MGKIGTIPHIGRVIKYIITIVVLYFLLQPVLTYFNLPFSAGLFLNFLIFFVFGLGIPYTICLFGVYLFFIFIQSIYLGSFIQLIYFFMAVMVNTLFFFVFFKDTIF
jgi:hypothetical protein|tara:strand:+ start:143 stop:463 length:321 start_codon:yes stop_codon:yes gene_type:complete